MLTKMPIKVSKNLASWVCGEFGGGKLSGCKFGGVEMSVSSTSIAASFARLRPVYIVQYFRLSQQNLKFTLAQLFVYHIAIGCFFSDERMQASVFISNS